MGINIREYYPGYDKNPEYEIKGTLSQDPLVDRHSGYTNIFTSAVGVLLWGELSGIGPVIERRELLC